MLNAWVFKLDATPPVGDLLCGGLADASVGVEQPLSLRGVIIDNGEERVALASVEFCYLVGRSYNRLVKAIARGGGVAADRVSLHATHAHDAPLMDEQTHALMPAGELPVHDEAWFADWLHSTEAGVQRACSRPAMEVTDIGYGQSTVNRFASTRRVIDATGRCETRFSICPHPHIRDAPEGKIDPALDAVVLFDHAGTPLVSIFFYACHPQVSNGRHLISGDTAGFALDLFDRSYPGVTPIYFTGCAGDVTAGKYTTTHRIRNRLLLGSRLFDAMDDAIRNTEPAPDLSLRWHTQQTTLSLRPVPRGEGGLREALAIPASDLAGRIEQYVCAYQLYRRIDRLNTYPFIANRLDLGIGSLLMLPAEMLVHYQLYAKQLFQPRPLAVAAYADSFLMYIPTDTCFDQGGFEVSPDWSVVCRGSQTRIEDVIRRLASIP